MPQSGFHGLVGLATARALASRVPRNAQVGFTFATVLGAFFPDIDMYPTAVAVLMKLPDPVYTFHRTATHNIFVVLLFALLGLVNRGSLVWRWVFWGLAIGTLTHEVLDVFFWFAPIDIMWPLSHWPADQPVFQRINVWNHDYLGLVSNLRDAVEFAAFATFLHAVRRIVSAQTSDDKGLKSMKIWEIVLWALFVVALGTAFVFQDKPSTQQIIVNGPYLLVFLPYCWSRAWVYRKQIAAWCLVPRPTEAV